MTGDIEFGCRIARVLQVREPSGLTQARGMDGRPYGRELVVSQYEHVNWKLVEETTLEAERLGYNSGIVARAKQLEQLRSTANLSEETLQR